MKDQHQLRVQRINRSKYPSLMQVVADHCGQPISVDHKTFQPARSFDPEHDALIFPTGVSCPALATRGRLWPAVEAAETQAGANFATLWEGKLPEELTGSETSALALEYAQHLADYLASVVHLVVAPPAMGISSRMRALCTTREAGPTGFGPSNRFNLSLVQRRKRGFPISPCTDLIELREIWTRLCDTHVDRRQAPLATSF